MDVLKQMLPGSANLHGVMQTADVHTTSHLQAEVGVHTTAEGFKCSPSKWLQMLLLFISYSLSGLSLIYLSSLSFCSSQFLLALKIQTVIRRQQSVCWGIGEGVSFGGSAAEGTLMKWCNDKKFLQSLQDFRLLI